MKTVIYIGDYTQDFRATPREGYLTVQQYSYSCTRSRNDAGFPYGPVLTTIMDFTIRLQLPEDSKVFHQRMHDNNPYSYSFICDPEFIPTGKKILKNYVSAMIVVGHIIDVEESLDAKPDADGVSKQVEMHVKLLISEITYIGKSQSKKLVLKQEGKESEDDESDTEGSTSDDEEEDDGSGGDKKEDPSVAFSKYALYIGKSAPFKGIEGGITHSVSQVLKDKDNKAVNVLLNSLSYHKKISQPNEITAILSITWTGDIQPTYKLLEDIFLYKRAELKVIDDVNKLDQIIAKNYYVYKMKPCFRKISNSSSIELELCIFSLDKLMTLDKFSKAHTAQKLGKDILTPELKNFKVGDMILEGDTINMQFLSLADDEMRIPYAVQYNESFYEFLQRITQRYGEFLYHENGLLHIGLKPTDTNYWNDTTKKNAKDWAESSVLKMRYYESLLPNALDVEDEYFPYLERKDKDSKIYVEEGKYYNPDPISSDENLAVITKDGYTSFAEKYDYYEKFIMEEFLSILNATSLAGILSNIIITESLRTVKLTLAAENDNELFNTINVKAYENIADQKDGDKLKQFATFNGNSALTTLVGDNIVNFTSKFYTIVRKMEKDVANKAVFLEFGEHTQPFSLGDKILVDGTDYVIVEIEGKAEKEGDVFNDNQKVMAIPYYKGEKMDILVPPALPIPLIREAKPQSGFITVAVFDPVKIGRVRFRYPWQGEKEEASPWVRVALPMATNGGSVHFKPEIGDEAMIDYENGNIDRPFIIGFMPSPSVKQTWGSSVLPDRGIMSKNGHSVTFSDGLDGGNFFWGWLPILGTIKGFVPTADWPSALKMKDDQKIVDLVGGTTITDRYGLYKISGSSDGRNITLKSPMGDISVSALTGIKIDAPNGDISINGKNVSIKACNKITLESGSNLKNRFVDKNFGKDFGLGLLNGVSKVVEKALDLSFLRTVMEIFIRPIDGTLKIKSLLFVMVEAGSGQAEVPRGSYAKEPRDYMTDEQVERKTNLYKKIRNTVNIVNQTVNNLVDGFVSDYNTYSMALGSFKSFLQQNDHNGTIISFNEIKAKAVANPKDADHTFELVIDDGDIHADAELVKDPLELPPIPPEPKRDSFPNNELGDQLFNQFLQDWNNYKNNVRPQEEQARNNVIAQRTTLKNNAKEVATTLAQGMNTLRLSAEYWRSYDAPLAHGIREQDVFRNEILNELKTNATLSNAAPITLANAQNLNMDDAVVIWDQNIENEKKILKRKMAFKMMKIPDVASAFKIKPEAQLGEPDYANDESWADFIEHINVDKTVGSKVKDWFYDHYGKNILEMGDVLMLKNELWKPEVKGKILFSDNPTKTVSFARNGLSDLNNVESISTRFEAEIKRLLGDVK